MVRDNLSSQSFASRLKSPQRLWSLALLSVMLLGASSEGAIALSRPANAPTAQSTLANAPVSETRLPRVVVQRVKRDLAQRFDLNRRNLEVVQFHHEIWPDSCLGLAAPNERCAMALVEGWQVEVTNGEQNWVYRTDERAQVIKLATPDPTTLPPQVVERLLETVAEEVNVPVSTLRITETQSAFWNGCMGIYVPDQACTEIGIPGWQVILAGENQSWVYHVSETGDRIVQNATASGSEGVIPSFIPDNGQPSEPMDENIVLRVSVSGGLSGSVEERILYADGSVYRHVRQPNLPQSSDPVLEQRLSPQQVQQFQQLLETQRFPNLDGLRYITDAAFADYPTTTLEAMNSKVEYIDLEQENVPAALQTVIEASQRLLLSPIIPPLR